jgi:hypothetical protein
MLLLCPQLLDSPHAADLFPPDAIARAKLLLDRLPGGTGAYSHSQGALVIREQISKGIEKRDGYPADPNNIFCTDGASPSVHRSIELLTRGGRCPFIAFTADASASLRCTGCMPPVVDACAHRMTRRICPRPLTIVTSASIKRRLPGCLSVCLVHVAVIFSLSADHQGVP